MHFTSFFFLNYRILPHVLLGIPQSLLVSCRQRRRGRRGVVMMMSVFAELSGFVFRRHQSVFAVGHGRINLLWSDILTIFGGEHGLATDLIVAEDPAEGSLVGITQMCIIAQVKRDSRHNEEAHGEQKCLLREHGGS